MQTSHTALLTAFPGDVTLKGINKIPVVSHFTHDHKIAPLFQILMTKYLLSTENNKYKNTTE